MNCLFFSGKLTAAVASYAWGSFGRPFGGCGLLCARRVVLFAWAFFVPLVRPSGPFLFVCVCPRGVGIRLALLPQAISRLFTNEVVLHGIYNFDCQG